MIADLTTANPNVFYELGVRHAARPYTTIPIFATTGELPFDVAMIRAIPYHLKDGVLDQEKSMAFQAALTDRIRASLEGPIQEDSPLFQLFNGFSGIEVSHELTDVFREQVSYSETWKAKLLAARSSRPGKTALALLEQIETDLGDLKTVEAGIIVDLMLSYRDISAWSKMVNLYDAMAADVQDAVVTRQQYALALNRIGQREKAVAVCEAILSEFGGSAETYGILGRVYKDLYSEAKKASSIEAVAWLEKAIKTYTRGFEVEPIDYYPGINAILLLFEMDSPKALDEIQRLIPLVSFAVARRGGNASKDYWGLATALTLALLTHDAANADELLPRLMIASEKFWMFETTADDLERIIKTWQGKEDISQIEEVYTILRTKQADLA